MRSPAENEGLGGYHLPSFSILTISKAFLIECQLSSIDAPWFLQALPTNADMCPFYSLQKQEAPIGFFSR